MHEALMIAHKAEWTGTSNLQKLAKHDFNFKTQLICKAYNFNIFINTFLYLKFF